MGKVCHVHTMDGMLYCVDGCWIVTEASGEQGVIDNESFQSTYMPIV